MPKLKTIGYNGFPEAKLVNCWQCGKTFLVKFVISRLAYSQKNNWGYWTERNENQEQEWCNICLREIYQNKLTYWAAVQSAKKRALFRVYLHSGQI